jgi:anaerobic magnesium-protoporphyrin IX monomethyl ester cyclase
MDLLLTHGYFLSEDPKEQQIMKPYAPLGLLYLSSHLRAKGFGVEIYDSTFGSREELFRILEDGPPSTIGIYGNLMTRANVLAILAKARECGWRVVLGGPEPPNYPDEFLNAGAEAIVQGEGELVLEELLRAEGNLTSINGIFWRSPDGRVIRNPPAPQIKDLDAQPWPDRERINLDCYLATWRKHHGVGSVSLITARGCPYHCRWCSHSVYGKTHRRRSPQSVAAEAEWLMKRYQPDMFWYADDVFTIHPGWILEYAQEMKLRGIRLPFECITRADRLNPRMAQTLAELGCFRVWIGSESGSQRILDAMERGVKIEQVQQAVSLCAKNGIQTGMFLMWGYEGEELSDIEATIQHVKTCRPDIFFTTVSYPIKGTPYYDEVAPKLVQIGDWAQSTDRDIDVRGRRPRSYYRIADELLKAEMAGDAVKAAAAREALRAQR